jgi:hypothetical protein
MPLSISRSEGLRRSVQSRMAIIKQMPDVLYRLIPKVQEDGCIMDAPY